MSDAGDFESSARPIEAGHSATFGPERELDELIAFAGSFRCPPACVIRPTACRPPCEAGMLAAVFAVNASSSDVTDETIAELPGSLQNGIERRVFGDQ